MFRLQLHHQSCLGREVDNSVFLFILSASHARLLRVVDLTPINNHEESLNKAPTVLIRSVKSDISLLPAFWEVMAILSKKSFLFILIDCPDDCYGNRLNQREKGKAGLASAAFACSGRILVNGLKSWALKTVTNTLLSNQV